ncbi:MAG TPA: hypothetical protein P5032_13250, partial [Candidatus Competibacter sp.]|nr:hypothetical protein [Candidatus Competibacter sp.]
AKAEEPTSAAATASAIADFFMTKLLGLCCMYTTKRCSQIIKEIYTHSEAEMQLIFSKKTQNLVFVLFQQQFVVFCLGDKKPT